MRRFTYMFWVYTSSRIFLSLNGSFVNFSSYLSKFYFEDSFAIAVNNCNHLGMIMDGKATIKLVQSWMLHLQSIVCSQGKTAPDQGKLGKNHRILYIWTCRNFDNITSRQSCEDSLKNIIQMCCVALGLWRSSIKSRCEPYNQNWMQKGNSHSPAHTTRQPNSNIP